MKTDRAKPSLIVWLHFFSKSQPSYPLYKYHLYLDTFNFFSLICKKVFKVTSKQVSLRWETINLALKSGGRC